jgi:hypothetical protein
MRKGFLLIGALASLAFVAALPGIANAAPAKGFGLQFGCTDGQSVFLVAPPGHAVFVPGIAVDPSGGVLKPVAFHVVNTVTQDGSVTVTTSDFSLANGAPGSSNPNVSVQCLNDSSYTLDGGGTLDQAITITGFFTGKS